MSELSGAIAKRLTCKNQLSAPGSFFNLLPGQKYWNTILLCIINNIKMGLAIETHDIY